MSFSVLMNCLLSNTLITGMEKLDVNESLKHYPSRPARLNVIRIERGSKNVTVNRSQTEIKISDEVSFEKETKIT